MKEILFSEYNYLIDKTDWHYHENPYNGRVLSSTNNNREAHNYTDEIMNTYIIPAIEKITD